VCQGNGYFVPTILRNTEEGAEVWQYYSSFYCRDFAADVLKALEETWNNNLKNWHQILPEIEDERCANCGNEKHDDVCYTKCLDESFEDKLAKDYIPTCAEDDDWRDHKLSNEYIERYGEDVK
jgi:hypothetical protein